MKKSNQLESSIEDKFVKIALIDYGCLALKFKKVGSKGGADRQIFCPSGHSFFIEFKRPGSGVISPHQIEFESQMKRYNKKVYFCDSFEEAIKILQFELNSNYRELLSKIKSIKFESISDKEVVINKIEHFIYKVK